MANAGRSDSAVGGGASDDRSSDRRGATPAGVRNPAAPRMTRDDPLTTRNVAMNAAREHAT